MGKKSADVAVNTKKRSTAKGATAMPVMPALHPWSALRGDMDDALERWNAGWPRMLRDFDPFERMGVPLRMSRADLSPRIDIGEDDKAYEISAELPGMEGADVDVSVDDGVLVLKGEKKHESDREERNFHLTERSYGAFERSFRLPDDVAPEEVSASFNQGVLKIVLPRTAKPKASARRISIDAG